ncbi:MAG TPA: vanadium-dependent haloperoxidase [Chitinophagaceae bacterium]|nr:vanadium-dependent haloperoxidase [Chitinophagaceae bacterium]
MKKSLNLLTGLFLFSISCIVFHSCQKEIGNTTFNKLELQSSANAQGQINNSENASAEVVIDWYKLQLRIILNANPPYSPLRAARIFAYEGIGLYEAVRHGIENSVSLSERLYQMPAMPEPENNNGYSWAIAANAALAKMVKTFFPNLTTQNIASIDSLENAYNEKLNPNSNSEVFRRSQDFGRAIAQAVFNWSLTDGDNQTNTGYVPPVFPGSWVPTPPAFASAFCPYLGTSNRPFLEEHKTAVFPAFPFQYSTDPGSDFYKMVKDIYDVSQTLTTDQINIALFWVDAGVGRGYTGLGHTISIINQLLEKENASLATAAIALAKTCIAAWDAFIIFFKAKYTYNLVRPVTFVQQYISPGWLPLIATPPHPEYPAAHATTLAEMEALSSVFGHNYAFTDHTYDFLGYPARNYSSLNAAGVEAGISRRYGGIHYLPSIEIGLVLAKQVGTNVANIQLVE